MYSSTVHLISVPTSADGTLGEAVPERHADIIKILVVHQEDHIDLAIAGTQQDVIPPVVKAARIC